MRSPIRVTSGILIILARQASPVAAVRRRSHTISDRANVLDMWKQMEAWLAETMAPRKSS